MKAAVRKADVHGVTVADCQMSYRGNAASLLNRSGGGYDYLPSRGGVRSAFAN